MPSREKELRDEDIINLREWLAGKPHLPKLTDDKLGLFLHCRDYDLEMTKRTIEVYYNIRAESPELFANRDPLSPEIQEAMNNLSYVVLPERDLKDHVVIVCNFMGEDPTKFHHATSLKLLLMYEDTFIFDIGRVAGYTIIMDSANVTFGHLKRMNINIVKKHITYVQDATPMKISEFHVINTSAAAQILFNLAKPFMSKRLIDKMVFHTDVLQNLYKTVPKEILPKDYGGKQKSMSELKKESELKVIEKRDILMVENKLQTGEKKPADLNAA